MTFTLRFETNENYLKLLKESDMLVTELSNTDYFNDVLKELNDLKLSFGNDLDGYINHLLRRDSYLWTLYGDYIDVFKQQLYSSKIKYKKWYENQLLNMDEKEKNGRWQIKAKYCLKIVQREYYWDQKKIIQSLESRYVRNTVLLKLSENLYILLMEKPTLQNALLSYIKEDGVAGAMYGGALNQATDKYLEIEGYKQLRISTHEYYRSCGYR